MGLEKPKFELIQGGGSNTPPEKPDDRSLAERYWGTEEDSVDLRELDLSEFPEGVVRNTMRQAQERVVGSADSFAREYAERLDHYEQRLRELEELARGDVLRSTNASEMVSRLVAESSSRLAEMKRLGGEYDQGLPDVMKNSFQGQEGRDRILGSLSEMERGLEDLFKLVKGLRE